MLLDCKRFACGLWFGFVLVVDWSWFGCGFARGLGVVCPWFGRGLGVVWSWFGCGLVVVCPWFGCGLVVVWVWFDRGLFAVKARTVKKCIKIAIAKP